MNSILTDAPCSAKTSQMRSWSRGISAPLRRTTYRTGRIISSRASAASDSPASGHNGLANCGPEGSPVLTLVAPERERDLTDGTPACGSSGCGLFGHEDPLGCSLRTCLLYELAAMTGYTMHWTPSVTPCGRSWWVLRLSARRTGETGSGLWPTADASEGNGSRTARPGCGPTGRMKDGSKITVNLNAAVTMQFPTPNAYDAERGAECRATKAKRNAGGVNLREACNWPAPRSEDSEQTGSHETPDTLSSASRIWSTPLASDALGEMHQSEAATAKGFAPCLQDQSRWCMPNASLAEAGTSSRSGTRKGELLLAGQCRRDQISTDGKRRGSLNPAWVSQLMGYLDGWLDLPVETRCRLSATPSSRKSRRRSSGPGKRRSG